MEIKKKITSEEFDEEILYQKSSEIELTKGQKRKYEIVKKAIELMSKEGIKETTINTLAESIKISRSNIKYYFPNMDVLIESCIQYVTFTSQTITVKFIKEVDDEDVNYENHLARLDAIVNAFFYFVENYPQQATIMLLLNYFSSFTPTYRKMKGTYRSMGAKRIILILKAISKEKRRSYLHSVDLNALACSIQSLIFSNAFLLINNEVELTHKEMCDHTKELIRLLCTNL
ncbi:MAG: TetR/AcrR family transcriptional regulator [Oligoflexia bacterium]|nr:TetR/AcrR family transcriptional regulator [Oligoflexia bacterium]